MASPWKNAANATSNKRTHTQTLEGDMEEELNSAPCPNIEDGEVCGETLTRKNKFCPNCGWQVNPSIFQRIVAPSDSGVYICDGLDDDEKVCGQEVLPTMKFCPHCGTKRKKVAKKSASTDFSDVPPVTSCVQVSKSLGDVGELKTGENEQAEERNIPERSSQNISGDDVIESREGRNLEFESPMETDAGEQDLASRDRNPNVASSENQPPADHQPKRFKGETSLVMSGSADVGQNKQSTMPDGDPTSNNDTTIDLTSLGSTLGDVSGAKKQTEMTSTGPESALSSTGSGRPMEPGNLSAPDSESKNDDEMRSAPYAGALKDKTMVYSTNSEEQQHATLRDSARPSDRSKYGDGQQSGSGMTATVSSQDGRSPKVPVRVLLPKNEREETNEFVATKKKATKGSPKSLTCPPKVVVHFHVVVSKEEFNTYKRSKGDRVIMIFGNEALGGWSDTHRVMTEEKAIDEKSFLMVLDVEMDKSLMGYNRNVVYKYAILHAGGSKEFEFVPKKSNRSIVDRELKIPGDRLSQCTEWHQYDGIMSREPEGGLKNFITDAFGKVTGKYYEQLLKRTKEAVAAMLPSWDEIQGSDLQCAKNLLENLDQVCFCAKNSFLNEKLTPDETKMKEFLEEFIQPVIHRLQSQIDKELRESETEAGVRLALASCLVYIIQQYGLRLDHEITKSIFHALLLRQDRETGVCHDYQQLVDVHFPTAVWRKKISQALLYFMSRMAKKDFIEPMWLLAVPLLHFLDDYIKPRGVPKMDLNHRNEKWWGIERFSSLVESFKLLNAKSMPLRQYMELLSPLFEQDRLLPRTLMSVMSLEHVSYLYEMRLIPLDVCLANAFYFAKTAKDINNIMPSFLTLEQLTKTWLSEFVPSDSKELEEILDQLCIQRKLSFEVLERVSVNLWLEYGPLVVTATRINANIISSMQQLLGTAKTIGEVTETKLKDLSETVLRSTDELVYKAFDWLTRSSSPALATVERNYAYSYPKIDYDEVQVYGYMCQVEFHDDGATAHWKATLDEHMTKRLKRLTPVLQILVFGDVDFSKYPPEVEACFSRAAFDVLENVENTMHGDYGYMFDQLDKVGSGSKLQELLSRMFEKSWPKENGNEPSSDEATILHHILTWPSFNRYLRLFYGRSRKTDLLSTDCVTLIQIGMSVFDNVIAKLLSGAMTVSQLKLLLDEKMKKNFLDLFIIIEKTSESGMKNVPESGFPGIDKCGVLTKVIFWRQTELRSFDEYCLKVNYFHGLVANLKSAELDELKRLSAWNHDILMVRDFCQARVYSPDLASKYQPRITYFSIPPEGEAMLHHFWDLKSSIVFNDMWNRYVKKFAEKQSSCKFGQVVEMWNSCYRYWTKLSEEIQSGDLTFNKVDAIFGSFDKKYDLIEKELTLITAKDIAVERTKQIEQYHQLDQYSRGASIMLKLKDEFELTGDFGMAENLVDMVKDKSKALREITNQLVDSGKQLEEITEEKVECLEVFRKHKKFADWLHKSVKGPKEVKVLVDLAMISAEGQGDMEVEKVLCLNAAANGYAPLIYDLTPEMGFREFLPLCQAVWRMLDVDPALPRKFRDTAMQLDWLNRVKESHGSVELNALANAQAINAKGIYSVGNLGNYNRKTLDNVVELKLRLEKGDRDIDSGAFVSEEAERGKWQNLNLQQLNDLQSKLMLVAGKAQEGKKEVDDFVEILDGVTRLGSLYIRICNAGCSLFHHWKAIFYCDPTKPMFARVEFGKEGKHIFCGWKKDATNGVSGYIFDLCTFMEDCLKEWLEHIAKQRMESYYLNYYTTEQLVILQNELPKINTGKVRISTNIYPLLSLVKKNCTLENVEVAMVAAFHRLEEMERMAAAAAAANDNEDAKTGMDVDKDAEMQEEHQTQQEDVEKFLKEMEDAGFCHKLAVLALKKFGPEKIEEGILWCLDHNMDFIEDDDEDCDMEEGTSVDKARQPGTPIQFTGLHLEKTLDSLTANLFKDPTVSNKLESLTKKLGELWRMYQNEMNTSLADYLSVKHLGCTLDQLAAMDDGRINRSLPGYMKKGKPNLILCSRAEILAVVLSIYMNGNARQNSLPGIDEVLLCNATTTAEDVELLWRRAEGDARNSRHGKIYCLVHAELLDYDVARKAEQSLDKHSHAAEEIQLVVVCCREQEDRSHIINALDRYRVKVPPVDLQEVRAYLQEHLTARGLTNVRPAAELDPERCSVRVIKSHRAGVGKSLKVRRLLEQRQDWQLPNKGYNGSFLISIPLHCKVVDPSVVLRRLIEHSLEPHLVVPRIFHIDIAHEVLEGVDYLLFNLLILGSITDREGYVWSRAPTDLYIIETMPLMQREAKTPERRQQDLQYVHHIFQLLPTVTCWSPSDSMSILSDALNDVRDRYPNAMLSVHDQKMDDKEFRSAMFQRPYQYLIRFRANQELHRVPYNTPEGNYVDCIRCLLGHCGIRDPSWSELRHFVNFLNVQLRSCEESIFCSDYLAPDLPGFLKFVVQFMIQMSKDFATRSLTISEETPEVALQLIEQDDRRADDILGDYGLKRRWETSPHPYLFFNADGTSFTFMGFIIQAATGDILEQGTNRILAPRAVPRELFDALVRNRVDLSENFDALPRWEKILKMCRVFGIDLVHDPDNTYELTADNVKKMLAIYMRFRCDIPVIVMGETGCGKTRLIKFMCDLWKPPGADMKNMILMKVHGGTTAHDIERKVREAARLAVTNREFFPELNVQTVLFFDEANTTEAIGMIKEIMCDHTIGGEKLPSTYGLKLIAACNPYRKHSDAMILRLEHAGLGYHIQAHQTADKLGRIPMRQLVYRVQSLPQSMLPLVWDFGQLSTEVETLYIRQMVHRYIADFPALRGIGQLEDTIARILAASQEFMRQQKDECSFVSLRDVDRALQVMMWFYAREKELFDKMNEKAVDEIEEAYQSRAPVGEEEDEEDEEQNHELVYTPPHDWTRALILALGVCYHACLQKRREYREFIARYFTVPCQVENGAQTIEKNINWCQDVFLDEVELGENIARNQALKENLFMMVICIELRIPLFLVGKPGSSKSLAKTIVADAMQGEAARSELFRALKSVHMVSYQCSPLSTPEGIVGTFRQCAKLQEGQDLNKFVSVVVLDEVGLAEDSDRMPLKTLHPLLEDGCEGDEVPAPHKKVGFIGISNWALDPAKMNRGILVQRGVPDEQELEQSAKGICAKDRIIARQIDVLVQPMAKAYLELYESALEIREFFGLRDFYSLIKMVYGFMKRSGDFPTWAELQHAVLRNFGGLDAIRPIDVFSKHLQNVDQNQRPLETDPACDSASLIRCSLTGDELDSESRYLLILTENYAALGLLQHELLKIKDAIIIFGSSFPKDQEYTQVCRNINRIKVCMETGRTVVLLNLENLYESLYDALNQYYVRFGDQRFVDLGLGTQRVKCRVHQLFRLIVVAEKQVVYEKFPIPLINRLEKHFLAMSTMLTAEQMEVADRLSKWAMDFTSVHGAVPRSSKQPKPADVFIGHHPDTAASLVLQVCHSGTNTDQKTKLTMQQILDEAKDLLLRCAVPEAILRLNNTRLAASANEIYTKYFEEQCHSNLEDFLKRILDDECPTESLFAQVTTHSRLLLPRDALHMAKVLHMKKADVALEALHAFGTEQQFCRMLREFFTEGQKRGRRVLLLQCDSGDVHAELIACARYNIWNEFCQMSADDDGTLERQLLHVIFIVQLPRIAGGCFVGFQGGKWMSYHIDDLHPHDERMPSLMALKGRSLGTLFEAATNRAEEPMEEEEMASEPMEDTEAEVEPMDVDKMPDDAERERTGDGFELLAEMQRKKAQEGVKFVKDKLESPEAALDVDSIIRSCLHGAAAMLKDAAKEEALKLRKTHRLQLLMELLSEKHAEEKLSLMNVLRKRLTLLLKDKEETAMNAVTANGWLSNEAASFEAICRAGTFRRALWQYLETRVTPLLAGVIAYIDTNANLDILMEDGDSVWITSMWMDMLSNADITMIKYKDLQTATQRMELTDFEVKTTGSDGKFFGARLPFSWIIKEQVDRLIYAAKQDASKDTRILVESTLEMSALGNMLEKAAVEDKMEEVIQRYLADFVRMVHKCHSDSPDVEYKLVTSDIEYAMRYQFIQEQDREQSEERHFIDPSDLAWASIPRIHLTYENIRKRLTLFSELVQIWPESLLRLADPKIPKNMPLDLICLVLLMEVYLNPTRDELDNVNSRQRWVEKVRSTSPIVVRLLESVSDVAQEHLPLRDTCRFTWNRVGAVKLFIEHVCPADGGDIALSVKRCMPLWTALTDRTDFKTLKSFETVENFLRICNKNAVDLYFGKLENCPGCDRPAEFPVKLPCGHVLCAHCLVETKELKVYQCRIAECLKPFPPDIKATVVTVKKEGQEKYTLYKQRCNAFFMDLVSCFCFTDNTPPENEVIWKLMGYVTRRSKLAEKVGGGALAAQQKTKKMFEESIDPTPVVRSFLLQLMLQADIDSVHEYLEQYFENARALVQTDSAQVVELCVLCVQCLEDHHRRQSAQCDGDVERLHFARDLLVRSTNLLRGDMLGIQLDSLEAIARVRYGLMETAKWMYQLYVVKDVNKTVAPEIRRLCDAAKQICHQEQLRWPRVYLMRQLTRQFGMDALKSISELRNLSWVIPKEAQESQNDAVPDRFVVCGDNYAKLRELIAEIVLGKGLESLEDALKTINESPEVAESLTLLAIYREVTAANIHADPQRRPTPEVLQRLIYFCTQSPFIKNKELAMEIVGNDMKGCMEIRPNQTSVLTELLIHFKILLTNSKQNSLQKPFHDIIMTPQNMQRAYLPTMPQDDMDDIRAAIAPNAGETPAFYQCPNGHPYVIGNCGNPNQKSKCTSCRAPIGGKDHLLVPGNVRFKLADTTRTGHVLGQPQRRAPIPERNMSPASTAILRMLLHMSMYLSSLENPQVVSPAIFPPVQPHEVSKFLLDHAQVDLETIHSATGHSEDDVIIFMHILIDAMLHNEQFVAGLAKSMQLQTKPSRVQWEDIYVNTYITPMLNGLNARVQEANNRMVNDERLGNNPLLRTVFEVDIPTAPTNIQKIHEEPSLWRYRSHISLEHLTLALDENMAQKKENDKKKKQQTYPILQLFLKDEHQLRAIRLLPNIIRLHRLLLQRLNRCLDSSDATALTIGTFLEDLQDDNQRQELRNLILNDFALAWDCVRPSLANYAFSGYTIPMDYTQEPVNENSRLAMLLPSLRGWGLCSVALIYYLQELQNNFLENYSKERKETLKTRVDIYDASYAHFIAYHQVHDLQPIILANCNYSLEVGKGTTIEYDFGSMEKQITERFIRGRPRLGIGRMEFILYREDFTNAAIFSQLRSRIPQEPLPSQAEMERELKHRLTDVTDLLASLNIAVGFLVSIGGDPEMNILRFMSDTLKMKQPQIAAMLETCKLKHVESLWLLLSYLRARMQATYGQDAFENVDEKYREPVPDDLKPKLRLGFQHIQMDSFLILLYECIIFNITIKQNVNAEDYADNSDYPLRDVLVLYMDESGSDYSIPALQDGRFPEEIKAKHCISTWLQALHPTRKS